MKSDSNVNTLKKKINAEHWYRLLRTVCTILAFFSCEIISRYSNTDCTHKLKTTPRNVVSSKTSPLANVYFHLSSLYRCVSSLLSLDFISSRIIPFHLSVYPRCLIILCQIRVVQCDIQYSNAGRRWLSRQDEGMRVNAFAYQPLSASHSAL